MIRITPDEDVLIFLEKLFLRLVSSLHAITVRGREDSGELTYVAGDHFPKRKYERQAACAAE